MVDPKPRPARYASFVGLAWPHRLRSLSEPARFKPRPVRYALFLDEIGPGGFQSRWSRRGLKY